MGIKKEDSSQQGNRAYVKYLGLSFQIFSIIGLGTWLGWYIQERSPMKFPVWIILGCFLSTFLAFYQLYISVKNDNSPKK